MARDKTQSISSLISSASLMPQESMVEVSKKEQILYIGIPKETSFQENRIPLIPESVSLLHANGHEIIIEAGAGKASNIEDSDFSEAGARIVYNAAEVYKADVILKVAPPSPEEVELIQPNQHLISILNMSMQNADYIRKLGAKKVTAIGYE